MCGICGKLNLGSDSPPVIEANLRSMLNSIGHRGPDEDGIYRSGPVGLGHRRLKIIDLHSGQQPMSNEDNSIWVIYNGEVYNYRELRAGLIQKGHKFKTASDTETIVHLYEEFGAQCVQHLRGMFSFALWDTKKKELLLARDRVGIKPLYYRQTEESLIFASEIKAILTDPSVVAEVEPNHIDRFLTYFYMPGEETLFKGIHKLPPGCYLTAKNGKVSIREYWDLSFAKAPIAFDQAVESLEERLSRTVADHMISDVPVGVLLSGGVDSSAMLSFAVENTHKPISTFTVGFDGGCTDERPYARMAAKSFGAENYEITITSKEFWDGLSKYVWHMEEPVCEPPAIALYYVSALARQHVTVLLSGEGGDEAFAGYQSYRNIHWLERLKRGLGPLAANAGRVVEAASGAGSRYRKYGEMLRTPIEDYYYSHSSGPYEFFNRHHTELYTRDFAGTILEASRNEPSRRYMEKVGHMEPLDQMLYMDTKTWLPDDLLIKADKMTMANSLELRVPLLDHQILEFAASLPTSFKLSKTTTKHILKKALSKRLPREILSRKKRGFPVPYATWLGTDLRGAVAEVLLDESALARGYFKKQTIESMINGWPTQDYSKELFSLVTLEMWHRTFVDGKRPQQIDEDLSCACSA